MGTQSPTAWSANRQRHTVLFDRPKVAGEVCMPHRLLTKLARSNFTRIERMVGRMSWPPWPWSMSAIISGGDEKRAKSVMYEGLSMIWVLHRKVESSCHGGRERELEVYGYGRPPVQR